MINRLNSKVFRYKECNIGQITFPYRIIFLIIIQENQDVLLKTQVQRILKHLQLAHTDLI